MGRRESIPLNQFEASDGKRARARGDSVLTSETSSVAENLHFDGAETVSKRLCRGSNCGSLKVETGDAR